ncbi:hypothetical protein [Pelobacter seleniigenes]|uniref:hypothetical protein n=1 Tax=Pelobacter seleniigenes TaxID=407188 RepID=UPI00068BE82D|nr:hypothetical protein [Pelobacter seleniigenes]
MPDGGVATFFYLFIASGANIPLGYMRRGQKAFTFGWFYYSLLSLPVILYLQAKSPLETGFTVLAMMGVVTGQLLGGLIKTLTKRKSADNGYEI